MRKFKLFTDAIKEELWLNDMLQKGWRLKHVSFFSMYTFEKISNVEQIIRLDCQSFPSTQKFQQYKQFHEEFGWVHLSGSRHSMLQYWWNPNDKDDTLFSDQESEKNYLQRLTKFYGYAAFFFLLFTMMVYDNAKQFTSPKAAYFTPGLWDKEGSDFFTAFILETPFALLRFGSPWLMLGFGIIFLNSYFKYKKQADKTV